MLKRLLLPSVLIPAMLEGRVKEVWLPMKLPNEYCAYEVIEHMYENCWSFRNKDTGMPFLMFSPYAIGDTLWLAETWQHGSKVRPRIQDRIIYKADKKWASNWYASTQMPQWASRWKGTVTGIEPREVKGITPREAQNCGDKERSGMPEFYEYGPECQVRWFKSFWQSAYPRYPFDTSWAWRYQIK